MRYSCLESAWCISKCDLSDCKMKKHTMNKDQCLLRVPQWQKLPTGTNFCDCTTVVYLELLKLVLLWITAWRITFSPGCNPAVPLFGPRPFWLINSLSASSSSSSPSLLHYCTHTSLVYPRLRPPMASCCCCCCCWWRNRFLEASIDGGPMVGRMGMFPPL